MKTAAAIVDLFNAMTPGIASLILMIRKKDGTVGVVMMLDEADANFAHNIQEAQAWLAAHPKS